MDVGQGRPGEPPPAGYEGHLAAPGKELAGQRWTLRGDFADSFRWPWTSRLLVLVVLVVAATVSRRLAPAVAARLGQGGAQLGRQGAELRPGEHG
jgi:hypothetical protein